MSRSLNTSIAACSSGVARPAVSSITETRYCISDHLLWFGVLLVGGRWSSASPMSRTSAGCILRAPSEPIGLDGYAPRDAPRADLKSWFPSPVVWGRPRGLPLTLATNACASIRHRLPHFLARIRDGNARQMSGWPVGTAPRREGPDMTSKFTEVAMTSKQGANLHPGVA